MKKRKVTHLHVFLPGNGGPHAIFLPRQNKHASGGFLSGVQVGGKELRPIEGDVGELRRNSVGAVVLGLDETCNDWWWLWWLWWWDELVYNGSR